MTDLQVLELRIRTLELELGAVRTARRVLLRREKPGPRPKAPKRNGDTKRAWTHADRDRRARLELWCEGADFDAPSAAEHLGMRRQAVAQWLRRGVEFGRIMRIERGIYRLRKGVK